MIGHDDLNALLKAKSSVYGPQREKVGTLGNILVDVASGKADFATIHLGLFGSAESLVWLEGAVITDGHLQVRYSKDVIRHAPNIDPTSALTELDKDSLAAYYSAMDPGTSA